MDFKIRYVITADNRRAKEALNEVDQILTKKKGSSGGGGLSDVFGGNLAADAVSKLTSKLMDGGRAVLDYASNLEQARIAMGTLMGDQAAANRHLDELMRLSRQTPLDFNAIAKMSQRLQGAGLQAKNLTTLIKDIGNIAAATGELTGERMEGIGVAISQVFSKGKVSAEEMEQLAERGVPAWKILSEALGLTTADARKLAEQGKITSQQFVDAFQKFSRMNYGDAMERQANTFSGAMGKISNIALQTANTAFQPFFEKISRFADDVADSLSDQEVQAKQAGVSFGFAIGEGIGDGLRRSGGLDIRSIMENYPGISLIRWSFNLGYDIAAGIDKGLKSYDETAVVNGVRMGIRPDFTYGPIDEGKPGGTQAPPPPGAVADDAAAKKAKQEAERRRREAERLAERDLSAAIRLEEKNLETIRENFADELDKIRETFSETGNVPEFFAGVTEVMTRYKEALGESLKFLEQLEDRGRSAMTEHEKALLTATQQERRDQIVKQAQEDQKRNNADLLRQHEQMGELAIERYTREAAITAELKKQTDEFREQRQQMLIRPGFGPNGEENMKAPERGGLFGQGGFNLDQMDEATGRIRSMEDVMRELGATASDVFMQMGQGLGAMVESWVLLGDQADVSMRKMLASVLAGVAAQAATLAVFHLAMGIAALTPWGAAMYGPAPLHFKAAAIWGAIAVGTALAGRAVAGDSFSKGGTGSGSAATTTGGRSQQQDQQPLTRQNGDTFISGRRSDPATLALARAVDKLQAKIDTASAGDVLVRGANQRKGFITETMLNETGRNSGYGTRLSRSMGIR